MTFRKLSITTLALIVFAFSASIGNVQAASKTATITLTPSSNSITIGQIVTVQILLNTGGQAASGADVYVSFPSNLDFTNFSGANSVFDNAVNSPSANSSPLRITRLRFDTGYNGSSGLIGTITFTAKSNGSAAINVDSNSEVYAYSDATNIYSQGNGTTITIAAPAATPTPSPSPSPAATTAANQPAASPSPAATASTSTSTNTSNSNGSTATSSPSSSSNKTATTSPKATSSAKPTASSKPTTSPAASTAPATSEAPAASPAAASEPTATPESVPSTDATSATAFPDVDQLVSGTPEEKANILLKPANIAAIIIIVLGLIGLPFAVMQTIRSYPKQ